MDLGIKNPFALQSPSQGPFDQPRMKAIMLTGGLPLPGRPALAAPKEEPVPDVQPAVENKTSKTVDRLCSILQKFSDREVDETMAGQIFWSYVDDARIPPAVAAQMIQDRCPGLKIPGRPVTPARELKKPEKEGFHGKTQISMEEALQLYDLLDVVLAPLTPEEAASEIADKECLRELNEAGGFPIVERLKDRLEQFLATAGPESAFTISKGEAVVTGKAVECAEALGRVKVLKTVVAVGGVTVVSGGLIVLLLGLI